MYWWITFENRPSGCAHGTESEAREIASKAGTVKTINMLPYPAAPFLHPIDHPPFCFQPDSCKGHSSCPRSYACSE